MIIMKVIMMAITLTIKTVIIMIMKMILPMGLLCLGCSGPIKNSWMEKGN